MLSTGNIIADSLSLGLSYAERLLKEVKPEDFGRFAKTEDGTTIESNHGAFIYGHLCLYAPRIVEQLGGTPYEVPEAFEVVFSKDATCQDDADGTIYPAMQEIIDCFNGGYQLALATLRNSENVKFEPQNPAEGRLRDLFPTIGSMHAFYAGGHIMMHMGQMSAWRRMIGLGPA